MKTLAGSDLHQEVIKAQKDLYLKNDDRVLFVVDNPATAEIVQKMFAETQFTVCTIPHVQRPGQDYVLAGCNTADPTVLWLITRVSVRHSRTTLQFQDNGVFVISNTRIDDDWPALLDPANRTPCKKNAQAILAAMGGNTGGTVQITSADDDTCLFLQVPAANWQMEVGERNGSIGTNGLYGELFTTPYNASGILVLKPGDFVTHPINELEDEVVLHIRDNTILGVRGTRQAIQLNRMLDEAQSPMSHQLGEFSFGLNPGQPHTFRHSITMEKKKGTIHVGGGTNAAVLRPDCPQINKFRYGRHSGDLHINFIKEGPITVTFHSIENRDTAIFVRGQMVV